LNFFIATKLLITLRLSLEISDTTYFVHLNYLELVSFAFSSFFCQFNFFELLTHFLALISLVLTLLLTHSIPRFFIY